MPQQSVEILIKTQYRFIFHGFSLKAVLNELLLIQIKNYVQLTYFINKT
jgi:hypothetical protein